jgi:acyl carrier protein
VDRNFFEVGGNSLLAIRVLSRLRQAYELNLPMKSIFDNPTIAATAATVEELLLADLSAEDLRI